jgi:hypothetical protein
LEFLRAICRVHKTLTLKAPEQVLQRFLSGKRREKHVVRIRKRSVVVPAIIWSITTLALLATSAFVWLHVNNPMVAQHAIEKIGELVGPLAPNIMSASRLETDADRTDEGAKVDSMLALQKPLQNNRNNPVATPPDSAAITGVLDSLAAAAHPRAARAKQEKRNLLTDKQSGRFASLSVSSKTSRGKQTRIAARQSPVGNLALQLDTYDIATKFYAEVDAGSFSNALALYKTLPTSLAETRKTLLYRLRSLLGVGDNDGVRRFLATTDVEDGEFYLEKARRFYDSRDLAAASHLLEQAAATPARFLDSRIFQERLLFARALCASAKCDSRPDADTRKGAIDAWMDVKSLLSATPDHKYFAKADSEIRRLNGSMASR